MSRHRLVGVCLLVAILLLPSLLLVTYENLSEAKLVDITKNIDIQNIDLPTTLTLDSNSPWSRENGFINNNLILEQGYGFAKKNYRDTYQFANPNPYQVVLFGDSFVWGNGDLDSTDHIGAQLEKTLNESVGKNIFQVTSLGQNGRSIYNYYDYFSNHSLKTINPAMLIYGFYLNDPIPSFTETLICGGRRPEFCKLEDPQLNPAYQNCLQGIGATPAKVIEWLRPAFPLSTQTLLTRYCAPLLKKFATDKFDFRSILLFPKKSPYYQTWLEALDLLKTELSPYTVHVANFYLHPSQLDADRLLMEDMAEAGYKIIPMTATYKLFAPFDDKNYEINDEVDLVSKIYVNPGNEHPSSYLNHQYVKDLANYVLTNLDQKKFELAKKSASKRIENPLISSTMPSYDVSYINNKDNSKVEFNKKISAPYTQKNAAGKDLPFQYANCLNLGYSNFQVILSEGIKGSLRVRGLDIKVKTKLGFYYYDKEFFRRYQPLDLKITKDIEIVIPASKGSVALVLGFPDYGNKCAIDKVIDAPDFEIALEHLPR